MLQNERINDSEDAFRAMLTGFQANLWTACPGIVQSYNAARGTVVVQMAIKANILDLETGATSTEAIQPQVDVPVCYMGGGGFLATFPIKQGDEALVVFASRCIDAWWQSGNVSAQAEPRMHSISDGFAIIGPRSLANSIPNVSTSTVQLRSLDGSTYYELAAGQVANIVAPGGINITGPVSITGDLSVTGTVSGEGDMSLDGTVSATGEGTFSGIPVSAHIHPGVAPGGSNTGAPVA